LLDIRWSATEFDPCTTAAPTTPAVIAFASDIDRSVRWYRENVGLEIAELEGKPRVGDSITLMAQRDRTARLLHRMDRITKGVFVITSTGVGALDGNASASDAGLGPA
jgi:hypothetical protein